MGSTNEILTVSTVWDGKPDGAYIDFSSDDRELRPRTDWGPWLLTFHLTDLGEGRLQCAGFEMRSYLKERPASDSTPATWADPSEQESVLPESDEDAAWLAERRAKGLPVPDLEVHGWAPSERAQRLRDSIFRADREAAVIGADELLSRPRELQAQMVGRIPFGSLLSAALRAAAREHGERADFFREVLRDDDYLVPMPAEEQERLQRILGWSSQHAEEAADELKHGGGRRPGRPSKRSPEELHRAAELYTRFCRRGERHPTNLLAKQLGIDPNVAAKIVHTCRRPKIGLLPPSNGPRPEAWARGEAPWE